MFIIVVIVIFVAIIFLIINWAILLGLLHKKTE